MNASSGRVPTAAWLSMRGPEQDVAISSRCRVARNVAGVPFPWRAAVEQLRATCDHIAAALTALDPTVLLYMRERASQSLLQALLANRYCSATWALSSCPGAVAVAGDGARAAMLNEEDHVRLQCLLPGLDAHRAADTCGAWASALEEHVPFAQHPEFGYLTASPQHAGAAIRIGILLHLAALGSTGEIVETVEAAVRTGCVIRGAFGEGSGGTGGFYQVSTTAAGRHDRAAAIDQAGAAARYLIAKERSARERLFGTPSGRADLHAAAAGACERLISEKLPPDEALRAVSAIRMSLAMGVTRSDIVRTSDWIGRCAAGLGSQRVRAMSPEEWRACLA